MDAATEAGYSGCRGRPANWIANSNRKEILISCENIRVIRGTVIGLHEDEEVKETIDKVRYSVKGEMGMKEQEAALVIGEHLIAWELII